MSHPLANVGGVPVMFSTSTAADTEGVLPCENVVAAAYRKWLRMPERLQASGLPLPKGFKALAGVAPPGGGSPLGATLGLTITHFGCRVCGGFVYAELIEVSADYGRRSGLPSL